jgi:hypothetical protein
MPEGQAQSASNPNSGVAKARYGIYDNNFPTGNGVNVKAIRDNYQSMWSLPTDSDAYINGDKVADTYEIQPGDTVEFHRRSGEKGSL